MARVFTPFLIACCYLLTSCAGYQSYTEGQQLMTAGDSVGALTKLEAAVKAAPNNLEYRQTYEQDKALVVARWVAEGDVLRASRELDKAEADYRKALRYDPANQGAQTGLALIDQTRKNLAAVRAARADMEAGSLDEAEKVLKRWSRSSPIFPAHATC